MFHSNQVREFQITDDGIKIVDLYLGPEGMLTGSARISQIAKEKSQEIVRKQDIESKQRDIDRKREIMEFKIAELESKFEAEKNELKKIIEQEKLKEETHISNRQVMAKLRNANGDK